MRDTISHAERFDSKPRQSSDLGLQLLASNPLPMHISPDASGLKLPNLAIVDSVTDTAAKLAREGELIARGSIGGALKETEKDPGGTAAKAIGALGVGAVLGVAATAASPWIAGTAVVAGVAGTGAWLWGTFNTLDAKNVARNQVVANALAETWRSNDHGNLNSNVTKLESAIGKDALDFGLGLLSGATAGGASRFVPGVICRELPSVGFKFFSQNAIAKAFPQRSREFEISDLTKLSLLDEGGAVQVSVREIFGENRKGADIRGPERDLLIGHKGAIATDARAAKAELLATCHPELLEPAVRVKSILQHAADVELQVDFAARRLRFLTLDKQRSMEVESPFHFAESFVLGDTKDLPLSEFASRLQTNTQLRDMIEPSVLAALRHHSLGEIARGFSNLPYKIESVKGAGAESIVFELAANNDAPIFAENKIKPEDVVLKLSDPKYAQVDDTFGMRPFDARRYGEFEPGKGCNYVAYLQEKATPVGLDDVDAADLLQLQEQMEQHNMTFYDQHNGHKQLGYTEDGRLVVIDWFAVLSKDTCTRPEELLDDFRPSK